MLFIEQYLWFPVTRKPTIETCFAGVHGKNGEHVTLRKLNSSSACMDQRDNYINFLPNRTEFSLQFSFVITPVHSKPAFIKEYKFGIGGGSVSLRWKRVGAGMFAIVCNSAWCIIKSHDCYSLEKVENYYKIFHWMKVDFYLGIFMSFAMKTQNTFSFFLYPSTWLERCSASKKKSWIIFCVVYK